MRRQFQTNEVLATLLLIGVMLAGIFAYQTDKNSWQSLSTEHLFTRVGAQPQPGLNPQLCCIYGSYSGCRTTNTQLQCATAPVVCNANEVYYGSCSDAGCSFIPDPFSKCGVQQGNRQVDKCTTDGNSTTQDCPAGQARCTVAVIFRGNQGCGTATVNICATGSTLCGSGQPTNPCDI
jgi:hypothetical protein